MLTTVIFAALLSSVSAAGEPAFAKPDPALTPGDVFAGVTASSVCVRGYAKSVRDVSTRRKRQVLERYGFKYERGAYEIDHLVSLALGGTNHVRNLWPQPKKEARMKAVVDACLHRRVCRGEMGLAEAQKAIATEWLALYPGCKGKGK